MDLLNKKEEYGKELAAEMLEILHRFSISKEDLKIAEEFFDDSKDMDLSLLDKLSFHDFLLETDWQSESRSKHFISGNHEKYPEMVQRYILYLDALGKNTISQKLSYNCTYQLTGPKKEKECLYTALKRRYDENMIQSKTAALLTAMYHKENCYMPEVQKIAQKNPMSLLRAIDTCCQGTGADWKVIIQLYAMGLGNIPVDTEDEEARNYISKGVAFLLDMAAKVGMQTDFHYSVLMTACFYLYPHSEKIEEVLMEHGKDKPMVFLEALIYHVPKSYLQRHMEKAFQVLGVEKKEKLPRNCILSLLNLMYSDRYYNNRGNGELLLQTFVKKKPEQCLEVMHMTEPVKTMLNRSTYYEKIMPCIYYPKLYVLLDQIHPENMKEYGLHMEKDMKDLSMEVILSCYQGKREELHDYLEEKCTLEEILPLPEKTVNYDRKIPEILMPCRKQNPEFEIRYIAISVISNPHSINFLVNKTDYKELIQKLLDAKVPTEYRFAAYDTVQEEYYAEKLVGQCLEDVLEMMLQNQEIYETEYQTIWKNGEMVTNKACLSYFVKTKHREGHKDIILSMAESKSSKDWMSYYVEQVSQCPEYEEDILALLKAKKQAVREIAVHILVKWGTEKYTDILLKAADTEKSARLADKIRSYVDTELLSQNKATVSSEISTAKLVENMHANGRAKKLSWLHTTPNSIVHFVNGQKAEDKYLQAILLCYNNMEKIGLNQNAAQLAKELKKEEFAAYARSIFDKWMEDGAQAKKKWVLYFYAIHGGLEILPVLEQCIKEWAENSRGSIAADAVNAMVLNGSPQVLMQVDHMAHKFKHRQVKKAAVQALEHAAEQLGITSEELGDRIVPNLGFDQNMEQIFDYGTRKFRVYLTPALELEIFDEDGKKRKSMPAPGTKDDAQKAKLANTEFKQMKKQLKNIVAMQKFRLENALVSGRCWDAEGWKNLFVANPVMHSFAIGLIWTAYSQGEKMATFRYMEDGTFNTVEEEEYELPEGVSIGLAHPIEMEEDELEGWKEQLRDYEIVQPIVQLEKKIYLLAEDEKQSLDLNRFHGRKVSGLSLQGRAAKLGWSKGSVEDAGVFYIFYREDVTKRIKKGDGSVHLEGSAVELQFSGMYVGMLGNEEEVEIENARFYHPGTVEHGSYVYDRADDKKAIPLGEVEPRYMSEMLGQLEEMTKNS